MKHANYPTKRLRLIASTAITIAVLSGCQSEQEKYYSENPDKAISMSRQCASRFHTYSKEECDAAIAVAQQHFNSYFKAKVDTFKQLSWDQLENTRCGNDDVSGIKNSSDCDAKKVASEEKLAPIIEKLRQTSQKEFNKKIRTCNQLNESFDFRSSSAEEKAICKAVGQVYDERYIAEHKVELDAFNKKVETYAAMDALTFSDKKRSACGDPNNPLTHIEIVNAQLNRFDLSECSAVIKAEEKRK